MAGPTVTLEFVGNESDLTSSMAAVGSSSRSMANEVGSASREVGSAGDRISGLTEGFDTVDTRAMGFRDTLTGLQDGFEGLTNDSDSLLETMLLLGFGIGDLASGFVNFLIPALTSFGTWLASTTVGAWALNAAKVAWATTTGVLTTAWTALNAVMAANPILTIIVIIGLLVAAFLWLWNNSEGFRNFFIGMWNGIKSVVGAVVDWMIGAWQKLWNFLKSVGEGIAGIFRGIGSAISGAFKGAVNGVIGFLNGAIGAINGLIRGINNVSGLVGIPAIPQIPKIPKMHSGGIVPGVPGSESLAILQAGEEVIPANRRGSGGGATLRITGSGGLFEAVQYGLRNGDIQLIDSSGQRIQVA